MKITDEMVTSDLLTPDERKRVEVWREVCESGPLSAIAIIDRLAPKPAPVQRTVAELEQLVRSEFNMMTQRSLDALDELVGRAK